MEALLQALESGELERLLERRPRARDAAPKQARRLRADEITELVTAYRQGSSVSDVARRFGISRGTASSHLAVAGVTKRTEMTAAERARIVRLFEAGHSANRIGAIVGRDPKTVRKLLVHPDKPALAEVSSRAEA